MMMRRRRKRKEEERREEGREGGREGGTRRRSAHVRHLQFTSAPDSMVSGRGAGVLDSDWARRASLSSLFAQNLSIASRLVHVCRGMPPPRRGGRRRGREERGIEQGYQEGGREGGGRGEDERGREEWRGGGDKRMGDGSSSTTTSSSHVRRQDMEPEPARL
eukprot:178030-Hanusia_phi.AAC.1